MPESEQITIINQKIPKYTTYDTEEYLLLEDKQIPDNNNKYSCLGADDFQEP